MTAVLCGSVLDHIWTKNFICKFTYSPSDNLFDYVGKAFELHIVLHISYSVNSDDDMDDEMPKHGNKLLAVPENSECWIFAS